MNTMSFAEFYRDSLLSGLFKGADKQLVEDFFNKVKDNDRREIYEKFIKNFKYFPKEYDSVINVLSTMIDISPNNFYNLKHFPYWVTIVLGKKESLDSRLVEPVLDMLEDYPQCGVATTEIRKGEIFEITLGTKNMESGKVGFKWLIPPKGYV